MPDLDAQVQIPEQDFDVPAEVNFGGSDSDDTEPARRDDRPIRDGDGDTESFSMGSLVLAIVAIVLSVIVALLAWFWTDGKAEAARVNQALSHKASKTRVVKMDQALKDHQGNRIDSASLASKSALRKKADKSRVDNLESELDSKAEADRVEKLEGRVGDNEDRLGEVEDDVRWLSGQTEENRKGLEELRNREDDSGTITIVPASSE